MPGLAGGTKPRFIDAWPSIAFEATLRLPPVQLAATTSTAPSQPDPTMLLSRTAGTTPSHSSVALSPGHARGLEIASPSPVATSWGPSSPFSTPTAGWPSGPASSIDLASRVAFPASEQGDGDPSAVPHRSAAGTSWDVPSSPDGWRATLGWPESRIPTPDLGERCAPSPVERGGLSNMSTRPKYDDGKSDATVIVGIDDARPSAPALPPSLVSSGNMRRRKSPPEPFVVPPSRAPVSLVTQRPTVASAPRPLAALRIVADSVVYPFKDGICRLRYRSMPACKPALTSDSAASLRSTS